MSLDLDFNKSISVKDIEEKTSLKIIEKDGFQYIQDQYGNTIFFKGYGITLYGHKNPNKILDELITTFDIMFIDDDAIDKLHYESEKYNSENLFFETMKEYGYVTDGVIKVPQRNEIDYFPPEAKKDDSELPF